MNELVKELRDLMARMVKDEISIPDFIDEVTAVWERADALGEREAVLKEFMSE